MTSFDLYINIYHGTRNSIYALSINLLLVVLVGAQSGCASGKTTPMK
jgi:hypothetical protein